MTQSAAKGAGLKPNRKLNPRLHQPTYLLNSAVSRSLRKWVNVLLPTGGRPRILDVGCGEMPYRALFEGRCDSYIGCDLYSSREDVVKCPADDLSFDAAQFDVVLSFQVLEHVTEPWRVIEECARVTRPGGTLIVTVPFVFPFHASPHDYYRYSASGLRHLAERAGFSVRAIEPQCQTLPTLVMLWNVQMGFLSGVLKSRRYLKPLCWPVDFGVIPAFNLLGKAFAMLPIEGILQRGMPGPSNFILLATRNEATGSGDAP